MPLSKKEKQSAARKNAEAQKAAKKQVRMTKDSGSTSMTTPPKGKKPPSVIKAKPKKK